MFGLIKTILVGLLALLAVSVAILFYLVKFDNKSLLARQLKEKILHYPEIISLINLNQPGDARFIYLSPRTSLIRINVYYTTEVSPDEDLETWLKETISQTTGKTISFSVSPNPTISQQENYSDQDLNAIRKSLVGSNGKPILNIVYLTAYGEKPGYVGITLQRDTIFIFKSTIKSLSNEPRIVKLLERSTLMHEWGHLLGLGHVDYPGCIMSKDVEVYDNRKPRETEIPVTHCQSTLYDLEQLKLKAR